MNSPKEKRSLRGWCDCGASFSGSSSPPKVIEKCYVAFRSVHDELGHHECDSKTAAKVRRAQRAAEFDDVLEPQTEG